MGGISLVQIQYINPGNFRKKLVVFPKNCLGIIFWFFCCCCWKFEVFFCSVSTFSRPGISYVWWNNEYILDNISRIWVQKKKKGLEKTYIDFSNNTFPIDRGIIKLLCYIWEIWFHSLTVLKYDDVNKKITWPWLLFWYFYERSLQYHTHAKFHS